MDDLAVKKLNQAIQSSQRICVFTGAGISCPSGIPDFRSADGLYNRESGFNIPPEQIISRSFFNAHTDLFYEFYKSAMLYPDAQPNKAHLYFANLEKERQKTVSIVTQNIDGLHTAAGSTDVYEIHGSVLRNTCMQCGNHYDVTAVSECEGIPICDSCGGVIKPDVVLYEEPLDDIVVQGAVDAISKADMLIIIGTSLVVYPAASYVRYFRGDNLAIVNMSETNMDSIANITIYEDVVKVVEKLEDLQ